MKTEEILNEREKTHGDFEEFAKLRIELAKTIGLSKSHKLNDVQSIAMSMILTKIARIICGDPNHDDHWDDIAGYAMLGKGEKAAEPCKHYDPSTFYTTDTGTGIDVITKWWICKNCNQLHLLDSKESTSSKAEEGINSTCRVCKKEISKGTAICYWCAVNEGKEENPKGCYCSSNPDSAMCTPCVKAYIESSAGKEESGAPEKESTSSKMEHVGEDECMNGKIHQYTPGATEKNHYVVNGPAPTECIYCQEEEKPKCNVHTYSAWCMKPHNCRCVDCLPECDKCGEPNAVSQMGRPLLTIKSECAMINYLYQPRWFC